MRTFIVDSFTNEPFKGNPAGVCFPAQALTDALMLQIAGELGLSETAFVQPIEESVNVYSIRYFSPKKEIPLCGHATLAAAKILFSQSDAHEIHFTTIGKLDLLVTRHGEEITMQFPVYDTVAATVSPAMLAALGIPEVNNAAFSSQNKIILLEINETEILASLQPDFNALVKTHDGINGVLVTAPATGGEYDFHYRYFWPWAGTNEDPVTGGVQTFLAKYWSERLHKKTMRAFQSSARTGRMTVSLQYDKVFISSQAVIILEGSMPVFGSQV